MSEKENFRVFIQAMSLRPGFYFGRDDNPLARLQAFIQGMRFARTFARTEKAKWSERFFAFENWLAFRLSGHASHICMV